MITSEEIRESFLSYFEEQGHMRMASASLIPVGDPTLLLTTAGMVQFKPYFSGESEPPHPRLTSSQKSFRTVDIDEVGDSTHLTFFEMLGNFSIGDYFKKEAIQHGLDCLSKKMGLAKDEFAITIHTTDDEAEALWIAAGIPKNRIFRFGDSDNWWGPAGAEGPCGPCSELHYDFGPKLSCGDKGCAPNCTNNMPNSNETCKRYVELWNLVFMQFYHKLDGSRDPLPAPSVDTGMGLERLTVILQNVKDIYDTDLFTPIIAKISELSGKKYGSDHITDMAFRVVSEHARSSVFLIADGVVPGNEDRGYVLRRIIRQSIRFGRTLGLAEGFLGPIADIVINKMKSVYPELNLHENFIRTVLSLEEQRFTNVFQQGYILLNDALENAKQTKEDLSGELAFKLWDTYGFPLEITLEIAAEKNILVNVDSFNTEMENQKKRGRASGKFDDDRSKIKVYESLSVGSTQFLGYEQLAADTVIVGLICEDERVSEVKADDSIEIVMRETPFYPEGGGQVGDGGQISGTNGEIEIHDTQTVMPGLIVHFGKVKQGTFSLGEKVSAYVHPIRREDTARNHTSTHMVHAALRQVLGTHVRQAGSYVAPDKLRFDFTHPQAVTLKEIKLVQKLVNEKIRANARVQSSEDEYTKAIERGALAFFGDKYEQKVRLVEIANGATFSFEVCGGTHVKATGEIGSMYILSEQSIGSGIRRLEAVSGRESERFAWDILQQQEKVSRLLQASSAEIESRIEKLVEENNQLKRRNEESERKSALNSVANLLDNKQNIKGISVLVQKVDAPDQDTLRNIGDWLRDKMGSGVVVVGAVINDRPQLVAMVTKDIISKGLDASNIAKESAKVMQGGGGGRADVAQAGGKLAHKLDDALSKVPNIVESSIKE